jgi:hypothetical protein
MSDNSRGIGQGIGFSNIYQQFKSTVPYFEDGEHVRARGEQLYLRTGLERLTTTESWQERQESLQAGADYVRQAIDREYVPGLGSVIFSSVSRSTGHELRHEVTRGDLEQINSLITRRTEAWDRVTANTYDETSRKIEALSSSGLLDVKRFAKEVADLRENTMLGATANLQEKWIDLVSRVDEAYRKSNLVQPHNQEVPALKRGFEEIQRFFTANVTDPGVTRQELLLLESEFRDAARKIRQEGTTDNADKLADLRKDAISKGEMLLQTANVSVQNWEKSAKSVGLDETTRKIELLGGWTASSQDAKRLKAELECMRANAVGTGKTNVEALTAFQQRVSKALDDWSKVHRHNAEIISLTRGDETSAHIELQMQVWKGSSEAKLAVTEALNKLYEAKARAGGLQYDTDRCRELDERRANVKAAAETLRKVYEASVGTTLQENYIHARTNDLLKESLVPSLRASLVPDASEAVVALQDELTLARKAAEDPNLPAHDRYKNAQQVVRIANELIEVRNRSVTSVEAEDTGDTAVPKQQAEELTELARNIASLPRSGVGARRSDEAQKAVNGTSAKVLAGMSADAKLSLLESLLATDNLPNSSQATKNDPLRTALRKLYAAMTLDPAFVKQDNILRERAVENLIKNYGKDFQFYRDNWAILEVEQREAALERVLEAHCSAMGRLPLPKLVMSGDADYGAAGHYNPKTSTLTICTSNPAFADFETMMDTVFHENTHYYQHMLARQAERDNPTQVKIFAANISVEGAYISGKEDLVDYKRQPIEAHAWMAGAHATSLLLRKLDDLSSVK